MERKSELEEPTLAAAYDKLCKDFNTIFESPDDTNSANSQERINKTIRGFEEITRLVSAVDMFSLNESVEEITADNLKFILLPYMLGALWQVNTSEDRKTVCQLSLVYFQDFLQRSFDYGIIRNPPPAEDAENGNPKSKSAQESRNEKIQRIKETKELESKIEAITKRQQEGEELDDEVVRELYMAKIRRDANKAESELAMIAQENQLIKFAESRKPDSGGPASGEPSNNLVPRQLGPSTYIITRNEEQKKVYGLGYPAVPVLTVEEFYQQRIDQGIWPGKSPAQAPVTINNAPEVEDDGAQRDAQEDHGDDPGLLQRQRDMDEYKDMHRRGWGNRANRS